jgi:transcription termination factor Rho
VAFLDAGLLRKKTVNELRELAKALEVPYISKYKKDELIDLIINGGHSPVVHHEYDLLLEENEEQEEQEEIFEEALMPMDESVALETGFSSTDNALGETPYEESKAASYEEEAATFDNLAADESDALGEEAVGVIDILDDKGFGFIRIKNETDIYVSQKQITRFGLRTGDLVQGTTMLPGPNDRNRRLRYVNKVNGMTPISGFKRPIFEELTPTFPTERFVLEKAFPDVTLRLIDLFSPIGKGQRGLLVAPPKAGKTMLLQKIAKALNENYPEVDVIVLLIDERPEEVTEMKRSIKAEVISSTFDEPPANHIEKAEYAILRAKNMVEMKKDVVILLDSITRLARAYNLVMPSSGRTLTGGFDPAALHKPKRFFGAARKVEEGGSLTIIATALIETGSKMDEVIFEEFKGTGNMELTLSRRLAEKRIFPAMDVRRSGTRREEKLLSESELEAMWKIRRNMGQGDDAAELLIDHMNNTKDNEEFIELVKKWE